MYLGCFNCKKGLNNVNADLRYDSLIKAKKKKDMNNKLGIKTCESSLRCAA